MKIYVLSLHIMALLFSCQQADKKANNSTSPQEQQLPKTATNELKDLQKAQDTIKINYQLALSKDWLEEHKTDTLKQRIVFALNRTDAAHFTRMDTVVIPDDFSHALENYLPFPLELPYLKDVAKIVYFSYPTQTFAAYENGVLKRTGPTNMGREKYLTPTGLFFTNWKAKVKVSTIDDEWILKWNFNIHNKEGIGWHQYSLPGYPASHSCLRLQEKDARFLYYWADQWILADQFTIAVKGTPVIIFGAYDFSAPKPWLQLIDNPKALDITKDQLQELTQPYLDEIVAAQKNRDTFQVDKE